MINVGYDLTKWWQPLPFGHRVCVIPNLEELLIAYTFKSNGGLPSSSLMALQIMVAEGESLGHRVGDTILNRRHPYLGPI